MGILLLLLAAVLAEPPTYRAATIDGATVVGSLNQLTAEQVGLGSQLLKISQVRKLEIDPNSVAAVDGKRKALAQLKMAAVWVETIDGDRLPGAKFDCQGTAGQLKLTSGQTLSIPTSAIRQVEFTDPVDPFPAWTAPDKSDSAADLLVIRKHDGIDFVEGAVKQVSDDAVTLNIDGEAAPVRRSKVAGIIFYHPDSAAPLPVAVCKLEDLAECKLGVTSVQLSGANLEVTTTFHSKLIVPLDTIKGFDFSASRFAYLSDLPEESSQTIPYLDFGKTADSLRQYYQPRRDHSLDGRALRLGGSLFPKGLMLPSGSTLVLKVSGKGKRLLAIVGIDDGVRPSGSVVLKISADGKSLYEARLTGHDAPAPIDLDVSEARRLTIAVEGGAGLDVGNYLDLCDARIVK